MTVNIATSLDDAYTRYTYVMILSALENKREEDYYRFFLLHSGLEESNMDLLLSLQEKYANCEIVPTFADKSKINAELPTNAQWTIAIYYRLMLTELLLSEAERIIYLDGDIIVNKSLSELMLIPFDENKLIMACEDYGTERQLETNYVYRVVYEKGFKYVNSGFLLMDLKSLRKKYTLDYYMHEATELMKREALVCPDQDILNYVHMNDIQLLDSQVYNLFAKQAYISGFMYEDIKREAAIVHYASQKPWDGQYIHCDTEKLWWDYAKKTPFYLEVADKFMNECLTNPLVYDKITSLTIENRKLEEANRLQKQVIDKLMSIVNMQQ